MTKNARLRLLWIAALSVGLLVGCNAGDSGVHDAKSRYIDALDDGSNRVAHSLLCAEAQKRLDPEELGRAYRANVAQYGLTGEWAPLRGSGTLSAALFLKVDGSDVQLDLPFTSGDSGVKFCPKGAAVLGSPPSAE